MEAASFWLRLKKKPWSLGALCAGKDDAAMFDGPGCWHYNSLYETYHQWHRAHMCDFHFTANKLPEQFTYLEKHTSPGLRL